MSERSSGREEEEGERYYVVYTGTQFMSLVLLKFSVCLFP